MFFTALAIPRPYAMTPRGRGSDTLLAALTAPVKASRRPEVEPTLEPSANAPPARTKLRRRTVAESKHNCAATLFTCCSMANAT